MNLPDLWRHGSRTNGTASSGRQTLDAAAVYHPDIVLLDLVMPAPGGFAVCEALSRQPPAAADYPHDGAVGS